MQNRLRTYGAPGRRYAATARRRRALPWEEWLEPLPLEPGLADLVLPFSFHESSAGAEARGNAGANWVVQGELLWPFEGSTPDRSVAYAVTTSSARDNSQNEAEVNIRLSLFGGTFVATKQEINPKSGGKRRALQKKGPTMKCRPW